LDILAPSISAPFKYCPVDGRAFRFRHDRHDLAALHRLHQKPVAHIRFGQVGVGEIDAAQARAAQIGAAQIGADERHEAKVGRIQIGGAQYGLFHGCVLTAGAGAIGLGQIAPGKIQIRHTHKFQVGAL
jgi:hypothetical protein